jgi:hypothetical protein
LLSNKIRKNFKKEAKNNVKAHIPTSDIKKSTTTEHTAIAFFLLLTTPLDQSRGAQNNLFVV